MVYAYSISVYTCEPEVDLDGAIQNECEDQGRVESHRQ